jgi:hypothetical protein
MRRTQIARPPNGQPAARHDDMDDDPTIALEGMPKPIFFDLVDVPTPRPDLGERSERTSSHDDLKRLAAQSTAKPPRPPDDDLLELKSGLFTIARGVPESVMPGPLVSEQQGPRDRTARRDLASWAIAVAAVTAATIVIGERFSASLSASASDAAPAAPSVTSAPPVVTASAALEAPLPTPPAEAAAPRVASASVPIHRRARSEASADSDAKPPAPPAPTAQALVERMAAAVPSASTAEEPEAAPSAPEFDRNAAKAALAIAAANALECRYPGEVAGTGRVAITFAPAGRVQSALILGAPFQATRTGSCIANAFRSASVPAFAGPPVLVTREVTVR